MGYFFLALSLLSTDILQHSSAIFAERAALAASSAAAPASLKLMPGLLFCLFFSLSGGNRTQNTCKTNAVRTIQNSRARGIEPAKLDKKACVTASAQLVP